MRRLTAARQAALVTLPALVILPERRHLVQTRIRFVAPLMSARTDCRFGSNRLGPTLCACDTVRPTTGPFPQTSHRLAIVPRLCTGARGEPLKGAPDRRTNVEL